MIWKRQAKPLLTFVCEPADHGIIAEPVPAKSAMPEWFKKLPAVHKDAVTATDNALTVKRCMPFLDALSTGFVLPLAASVRLHIRDGGQSVEAGWEFDKVMVSNHNAPQVQGHPHLPRPPCKFHNYWTILTPPGWSCLFVPPLNRPNPVFECVAGVVDTDTYRALIHFPFSATGADGVHVIEKGTPLVQVIPFRRDTTLIAADIRPETPAEALERDQILRHTKAAEGWYRQAARARR